MGQRSRAVGLGAPIATLPGFEMLADGASRFFVQLTKTVEVEETRTNNRLTYRLKGARVAHMNNENALAWYRKRNFRKLDAAIFLAQSVTTEPELLPPRELPPPRNAPTES